MILECDIGNTRTKWRLLDGRLSVDSGSLNTVDCGFHGLPVNPVIERVRVACVAGSALELKLQAWVSENLGLSCEFARTGAQTAGLTNCYEQPDKMGVDRWLAAVAAYNEYRSAVLVIDLGSALTAEVVDGNGTYSLQLGSFRSAENARAEAERIAALGHAPVVEVASLGGQTYHRVVLRGLADRNEAERLGENIRSQLGITYLIRQK